MDVKRSVNTRVWMDGWFEELKPDEKLLWLYLLTNPMSNMLGIYEVSVKRMANDTGITQDKIRTILEGFERVRKAFYWFERVVLPNWMKHQSMNTNMIVSAKRNFNELPNELIDKLKENGFEGFESLSNGSATLPKIEKEIEREIEKEDECEKSVYLDFISIINSVLGKKYRGDDKSKVHLKARIKEGWTLERIKIVIENYSRDEFHKNNGYKYLTPEFLTRQDKLDKGENLTQNRNGRPVIERHTEGYTPL